MVLGGAGAVLGALAADCLLTAKSETGRSGDYRSVDSGVRGGDGDFLDGGGGRNEGYLQLRY